MYTQLKEKKKHPKHANKNSNNINNNNITAKAHFWRIIRYRFENL
jgi:hypothetical protein